MKTTPTNPPAAIRLLAVVATIGLFGAASAPALSDDGFITIHMDNQKIGSAQGAIAQVPDTIVVSP